MPERIPETLQKRLADRLSFYQDLGIRLFYRDRGKGAAPDVARRLEIPDVAQLSTIDLQRKTTLPKPTGKLALQNTAPVVAPRSEEHTSELQSPCNLVCRLLLETKNSSRR